MAHKNSDVIVEKVNAAKEQIQVGDLYYHYKNPQDFYIIIGIGLIEATETPCVIYHQEYAPYLTWVRPVTEFLEFVEIEGTGEKVARFTKVD